MLLVGVAFPQQSLRPSQGGGPRAKGVRPNQLRRYYRDFGNVETGFTKKAAALVAAAFRKVSLVGDVPVWLVLIAFVGWAGIP